MTDTLAWLLDSENPSVRYRTLTELLGKQDGDPEVIEAKASIMHHGPVPAILSTQNEDGSFGEPARFYVNKYGGTVWNLLILAELAADPGDPRVRKSAEFIMTRSYEPDKGGFSVNESTRTHTGLPGGVIPCLTGNMVYALSKLGHMRDPRVQKSIGWLTSYQRTDDGESEPPGGYPYDRFEMCFGKHVCHMGVAKALKGLAAIPEAGRSDIVKQKIAEFTEYFLKHRIHRKSHEPGKVARPGWQRFGFPLMYQTDILELLEIMASLGVRDERLSDALEVVARRKLPTGRWALMETMNGRTTVDIEKKGDESRWVTLRALRVERFYLGQASTV